MESVTESDGSRFDCETKLSQVAVVLAVNTEAPVLDVISTSWTAGNVVPI